MRNVPHGWKVTKDDSVLQRGGRICGTRVEFADGRFIRWAGRMTQKEAVRQTTEHLRREAMLNEPAASKMSGCESPQGPPETQMVTYCDCGDYCAWCRPDLCAPSAESDLEQARRSRAV